MNVKGAVKNAKSGYTQIGNIIKKCVICFDRLEQVLEEIVKVNKLVLQSSENYMNGASISMWSISNINYQVLEIGLRYYFSFNLIIQSL